MSEQVGETLDYAHGQDLVHRDIKPANIVLDTQSKPKLTDFDLVLAGDTTGGTRTGFLGSYFYAAPEAMRNAKEVDVRADVYGLGMTAIFALQGADPDFVQIWFDSAALLSQLPVSDGVQAVLQRATAREREDRHQSVRAFCDALAAVRHASPEQPDESFEPDSPGYVRQGMLQQTPTRRNDQVSAADIGGTGQD